MTVHELKAQRRLLLYQNQGEMVQIWMSPTHSEVLPEPEVAKPSHDMSRIMLRESWRMKGSPRSSL